MTKNCVMDGIHFWHGLGRHSERGWVYGASCTCGWQCRLQSRGEVDTAVAAHLNARKG